MADYQINETSVQRICDHCHRPIRFDALTYNHGGKSYHFECTEPAPAMGIAALTLKPGDSLVVMMDQRISIQQAERLTEHIKSRFPVEQVLIVDGGAWVAVLSKTDSENYTGPFPPGDEE